MPTDPFRHILEHCGNLTPQERCLIVVDASTRALAAGFFGRAQTLGADVELVEIPVADRHGQEPPVEVAALMTRADLVLGLTKMSMAHTPARQAVCAGGGRYLSLAGYSSQMLTDRAVLADFRGQYRLTRAVADAFTAGSTVRVTTAAGTDVRLVITGREGNCCPGFVDELNLLGSPPDIEANVSPVETLSEGVAVVDGSVACDEIGLVDVPIILRLSGGRITDVTSERSGYVTEVKQMFARIGDLRAYTLAECGIGLNPLAVLTGNMLTDEGTMGCVHFGFGSNITVGGRNDVPFHVDFVMREASLWIDSLQVLRDGTSCL